MKRKFIHKARLCAFLLLTVPIGGYGAEKEVSKSPPLMWFDFTHTTRFNDKWAHMTEISERFFAHPRTQSQLVFRTYGLYNAGENWNIGQGFSVFLNKTGDITIPELRPEQQFMYQQKFEKPGFMGISHRFRIEERLTRKAEKGELLKGYTFAMRFRYRFGFDFILVKTGANKNLLKLLINDEIFLNAGKQVVYNTFDQNRFYAGASYQIIKSFVIAIAYMNIYKQKSSGNKYELTHTFRVSFQHQFTLKKKNQ